MKETNDNITDLKQIGNLTELQCITRFYELGYSVSIPYGDSEKYDFILDINGSLYKIQCKHANVHFNNCGIADFITIATTWQSGYSKNKKLKRNTYSKDEIDYFVTHFNKKNYLIPVEKCNTVKTLRILPPKNNQLKGINLLDDYADEKICSNL